MCSPASFIVTKDKVFWSKRSDSHEDIIREFDLCVDGIDRPKIVRVEITPPDNNFRIPLEDWQLHIDEVVISLDLLPSWFNMDDVSKRTREALKKWADSKLIIDENKTIYDQQAYVFGKSYISARGTSLIEANDESIVEAYDRVVVCCRNKCKVKAYQNSSIICREDCVVESYDYTNIFGYHNCNIRAYYMSIINAYDDCVVHAHDKSIVRSYDNVKVFRYDQAVAVEDKK